jgi:hypothetical protein
LHQLHSQLDSQMHSQLHSQLHNQLHSQQHPQQILNAARFGRPPSFQTGMLLAFSA